ncbi:MAG: serine/threonine protein kinase, partial [Gemmatimonadales bacterium]|nr:serine/threonine protein kinase [Gemmatimonadales bacterium]
MSLPEESRFCMICGADLSDPEVSTRQRAAVKELFEAVTQTVQDRYRVSDMLGRGGMGAVFLAEDLRLGRMVALKVLRPELAEEASFVRRFEREAKIAAGLDHSNIIPIYEVEQVGDFHFFVMKYVDGKSLDELLAAKSLPMEHALDILWQTACGLGHAHRRGVIHRDVKPSNIMVDDSGRVVITDFGISKALEAKTQYTSEGQMIGTPRYLSPEQAKGQPLDGRSDQYSLAVVGYEMLVGQLPLVADTVHALMYMHIYEMPTPAGTVRPAIPPAISNALQRALSKDPEQRFPSMEAFASTLLPERQTESGPISWPGLARHSARREATTPTPPTVPVPRWRSRRPALALVAAAALVLGVAVAGGWGRGEDLAVPPAPGAAPQDLGAGETGTGSSPAASPADSVAMPAESARSEPPPRADTAPTPARPRPR